MEKEKDEHYRDETHIYILVYNFEHKSKELGAIEHHD